MALIAQIGKMKQLSPADESVQQKIAALQQYITDHFYTCNDEILAGLGQMYVQDDRFRRNIDSAGGDGCAQFVSSAIQAFLRK